MWDLLERYLDRLDELRRFLSVADAIEDSEAVPWKHAKREARGSAIVCAMAELEALVVGVLCEVNGCINNAGVTVGSLRASLRALAAHREFMSLVALNDAEKVWRQREVVACLDSNTDIASLPVFHGSVAREPQPPLDGRTLKPHHFQRVCSVYGIPVSSVISTHETLSLKKLSNARNDIAHGNVPFHEVFSRAGFLSDEIRADLDSFDVIGYGLVRAFDQYILGGCYLSSSV